MSNIQELINQLPPELLPYKDKILATIKPVINIDLSKSDKLTIYSSKFGGKPYLPKEMDYPTKSDSTPLVLLAQINLADVAVNDQLPKQGMLSFFIAGDDLYGLDFDNRLNQDGFRVLYFENIITDESQVWQDFSEIDKKIHTSEDYEIMWGDSDVGNFFIHPDDLKNKDFNKVLYNYDCY